MRQFKITASITNRSAASLQKYLTEVSRLPTITAEEEYELFEAYRKGDANAAEKLVKANLRFVVSVAKRQIGGKIRSYKRFQTDLLYCMADPGQPVQDTT